MVTDPGMRYERAIEEVKRLVDEADPMGLVVIGAPDDEYDSQAREVARHLLHGEAITEEWVRRTWPEWFGRQPPACLAQRLAAVQAELLPRS